MASGGPRELQDEVLSAGLCTACGMCLDLCPWLGQRHERVAFVARCQRDEGTCWAVCPHTPTDRAALRARCAPDAPTDPVLGPLRALRLARAADPELRRQGQYGGTVSALAAFGLESGRADAALLTAWGGDPSQPFLPRPFVARTPEQVAGAAGSKYTACPTLMSLDQTLRDGARRLLVVGRPCQVTAVRKRGALDGRSAPDGVALVVGLFCMWALSYRAQRELAGTVRGAPGRVDVPPGRFVVETDQETAELPYEAAVAGALGGCAACEDFGAELSDLSVGSTEWRDDWNTLLVRTAAGETFVEAAATAGRLELAPFPEPRAELLRQAAAGKRRRARQRLRAQDEDI